MSGISQLACKERADETISADQQDSHRRVDGSLSISHIVAVGRQLLPWDYFRVARHTPECVRIQEFQTSVAKMTRKPGAQQHEVFGRLWSIIANGFFVNLHGL